VDQDAVGGVRSVDRVLVKGKPVAPALGNHSSHVSVTDVAYPARRSPTGSAFAGDSVRE